MCRICNLPKKHPYGVGRKLLNFIRIVSESEEDYCRINRILWKYELGETSLPSKATFYRHRKNCLKLPRPKGKTLGMQKKSIKPNSREVEKRMLEELKAFRES